MWPSLRDFWEVVERFQSNKITRSRAAEQARLFGLEKADLLAKIEVLEAQKHALTLQVEILKADREKDQVENQRLRDVIQELCDQRNPPATKGVGALILRHLEAHSPGSAMEISAAVGAPEPEISRSLTSLLAAGMIRPPNMASYEIGGFRITQKGQEWLASNPETGPIGPIPA